MIKYQFFGVWVSIHAVANMFAQNLTCFRQIYRQCGSGFMCKGVKMRATLMVLKINDWLQM